MTVHRARGRALTWLCEDRFGVTRRWYEHLPLVGDELLRRRVTRMMRNLHRFS